MYTLIEQSRDKPINKSLMRLQTDHVGNDEKQVSHWPNTYFYFCKLNFSVTLLYCVNACMLLGNFRRDSCNYSPSSSPDVINVAGTQQAVDAPHPGKVIHKFYKYNYIPMLMYLINNSNHSLLTSFRTTYAVLVQFSA